MIDYVLLVVFIVTMTLAAIFIPAKNKTLKIIKRVALILSLITVNYVICATLAAIVLFLAVRHML